MQIDTNQGRYVLTSNGDLTIVQVRQSDDGTYVCVASNGLGEPVRREVPLQVTGEFTPHPPVLLCFLLPVLVLAT